MRMLQTLAILTKRQIVDDGPYLIGALLISLALILAAVVAAFFVNSYGGVNRLLPVPTAGLLVMLFALVCVGSCVFGVRQVHADQAAGISAVLSTLSVGQGRIFVARILIGVIFLLAILAFLFIAVVGAMLFDLLPGRDWLRLRIDDWPASLFPCVLIHASVDLFLVFLTCYLLGLRRARKAATLAAAMDGLLAMPILVLLIVIKGFTLLSIAVLVLFIACLLADILIQPGRHYFAIITVGLIECILISVPLFCGRYLWDVALGVHAAGETSLVDARPLGLIRLGTEIDTFPVARGGIRKRPRVLSSHRVCQTPHLLRMLGVVASIESRFARQLTIESYPRGYWRLAQFDDTLGQLVARSRTGELYAGPEGVASSPHEHLGRFTSPILGNGVVFDQGCRQFYAVDIENRVVRKGETLQDDTWEPVSIFPSPHGSRVCWVGLYDGPVSCDGRSPRYVAILDRSGDVALLDRQTLSVLGWAGNLPRPRTSFGYGSRRPENILDYDIALVAEGPDSQYAGMIVGCLSRQGTSLTLAVFDRDGREIRTVHSQMHLFETLSGSILATDKYVIESLHPPVLVLASFFTAYSFEAGATHRALFLMPNSFVALQRDRETSMVFQFIWALVFLVPAMVFAGFLSWCVVRDARTIGVPRRTRWLWLAGTLALGLPAYITYRLTRPKVVLMPCMNCGHGRRVDRDLCHHCGQGWDVPELDPPAWRITGDMPQVACGLSDHVADEKSEMVP